MVHRLMGDQISALFVPPFAGKEHARVALHAALELLRGTDHSDSNGPWMPIGVGVHTGTVYVGVVGSANAVSEIAVLGRAANLCARFSYQAAAGGNFDVTGLENRVLELKGISQPVLVRVWKTQQNDSQVKFAKDKH
jgi:adenylate cyclase